MLRTLRERSCAYGLPEYLQHDPNAFKAGLQNDSTLLGCLWGELYGSIHIAEISEGVITTRRLPASEISLEKQGMAASKHKTGIDHSGKIWLIFYCESNTSKGSKCR